MKLINEGIEFDNTENVKDELEKYGIERGLGLYEDSDGDNDTLEEFNIDNLSEDSKEVDNYGKERGLKLYEDSDGDNDTLEEFNIDNLPDGSEEIENYGIERGVELYEDRDGDNDTLEEFNIDNLSEGSEEIEEAIEKVERLIEETAKDKGNKPIVFSRGKDKSTEPFVLNIHWVNQSPHKNLRVITPVTKVDRNETDVKNPDIENVFKFNDENSEEVQKTLESYGIEVGYKTITPDMFDSQMQSPKELLPDANSKSAIDTLVNASESKSVVISNQSKCFSYDIYKELINRYNLKVFSGTVYCYISILGCYSKLNESQLRTLIRKDWDDSVERRLSKSVVGDISDRLRTCEEIQVDGSYFDSRQELINFRNGVLDVKTKMFNKHSPKYAFTWCIDVNYSENPTFGKWFHEFIITCTQGDKDKILHIQEIVGYLISGYYSAKVIPFIIGEPNSGKSVLMRLITRIIGEENVSNAPLHRLHDRFVKAVLSCHRLNVCSEISNSPLTNIDVIKSISGNDEMLAEFKGKPHFKFKSKIKLAFAGNSLPPIGDLDTTTAFFDRLTIVFFNHSVPAEERDLYLEDKMYKEKEYIIQWALEGLYRLQENNFVFNESQESVQRKQQYIREQDHVPDFINMECVVTGDGLKVHLTPLIERYKSYCKDNCCKPLPQKLLEERIMNITKCQKTKFRIKGSKPLTGFLGIEINGVKSRLNQIQMIERLER